MYKYELTCLNRCIIMHSYTREMNNHSKEGARYEKRKKDYFNIINYGMHEHTAHWMWNFLRWSGCSRQ